MNTPQSQEIVNRFFGALDMLIAEGRIRGIQTFTDRYGIDKRNFYALRKNPSSGRFQAAWLTILVTDFGVSADWLLTGRGAV